MAEENKNPQVYNSNNTTASKKLFLDGVIEDDSASEIHHSWFDDIYKKVKANQYKILSNEYKNEILDELKKYTDIETKNLKKTLTEELAKTQDEFSEQKKTLTEELAKTQDEFSEQKKEIRKQQDEVGKQKNDLIKMISDLDFTKKTVKILNGLIVGSIIGIVVTIILLATDLFRESDLHSRITELEREIVKHKSELLDYKIDLSKKIDTQQKQIDSLPNKVRIKLIEENVKDDQVILGCLKVKKYWQYEQCFE